MNFKEYLTEIKTQKDMFSDKWYVVNKTTLSSHIHIDKQNKITVDNNLTKKDCIDYSCVLIPQYDIQTVPIYAFKFFDSAGNIHATSALGSKSKILLPAVAKVFERMVDELISKDSVVIFSANLKELTRISLYDELYKKLNTYKYTFTDDEIWERIFNGTNPKTEKYYGFATSKYAYFIIK